MSRKERVEKRNYTEFRKCLAGDQNRVIRGKLSRESAVEEADPGAGMLIEQALTFKRIKPVDRIFLSFYN